MAKLMAPNIRIDWYPEDHFEDALNPTVAELNNGVNLSPAIVTGFTLDFTDSETVDTTNIYESFTKESITHHGYEANLQFFLAPRGSEVEGNETAYRTAEELFYLNRGARGYLVKRFGYKWDTSYRVDHKVDIFLVEATLPKIISEEDSPILMEVLFLPLGEASSSIEALNWNLLQNGDFNDGINLWHFNDTYYPTTPTATTAHNHVMWGGLGGSMLHAPETRTYNTFVTFLSEAYAPLKEGMYVGYSAYFAFGEDTDYVGVEFRFNNRSANNYRSQRHYGKFYSGVFIHMAVRVPSDADYVEVKHWVYKTSGESTRFWADKIMVSTGNTEEEALANSAVFKPHKDDI